MILIPAAPFSIESITAPAASTRVAEREGAAAAARYAEDCVFGSHPFATSRTGRDYIRRMLSEAERH